MDEEAQVYWVEHRLQCEARIQPLFNRLANGIFGRSLAILRGIIFSRTYTLVPSNAGFEHMTHIRPPEPGLDRVLSSLLTSLVLNPRLRRWLLHSSHGMSSSRPKIPRDRHPQHLAWLRLVHRPLICTTYSVIPQGSLRHPRPPLFPHLGGRRPACGAGVSISLLPALPLAPRACDSGTFDVRWAASQARIDSFRLRPCMSGSLKMATCAYITGATPSASAASSTHLKAALAQVAPQAQQLRPVAGRAGTSSPTFAVGAQATAECECAPDHEIHAPPLMCPRANSPSHASSLSHRLIAFVRLPELA
jgi:hypothetical protein